MKKFVCLLAGCALSLSAVLTSSSAQAQSDTANQAPQAPEATQAAPDNSMAKTLYFFVEGPNFRSLYVAEHYRLGDTQRTVTDDPSTLNLKLTTKSHIVGSDDTIPLKEVKSFYFGGSTLATGLIGNFQTTTVNNEAIQDKSYQNPWPIKHYGEGNHWSALVSITGTAYDAPANIRANATLDLGTQQLSRVSVSLVTEAQARQWMNTIQTQVANLQKQRADENARNAARAQKEEDQMKENLAQMAKQPRGSEDSCKRTDLNGYTVRLDPEYVRVKCQFGGLINLAGLTPAGWLVVNKTFKEGVVTDYYIRKAR